MSATARAVIYLRQSIDATGDGLAVDRQRDDCRRIAADRGWTVIAEYVDNSISASSRRKTRPAYNRMVEAYQAGAFNALICWDLDRLTRQPRQLEDWIDAAEDRGLVLVTANGEADLSTDAGRLFARIKASVARAEVDRKATRQRRAALQRSELGRPPAGTRLTGYTTAGELVEHEAAVVREVFERFAAGDSIRSLGEWLDEIGFPTRSGRPWHPSSVRGMLTNPRYAGRAVYQGKENGQQGTWKAIVTDDVFTVTQVRLADPRRKTSKVGTNRRHLGSGLYLCGVCGVKVVAWSGNRYHCPNGCLTRSQAPIDAVAAAAVRTKLAEADPGRLLNDESGEARAVAEQITALRARLVGIEQDYDSDLIDGRRFAVATEKVRAQLAEAERQQARITSGAAVAQALSAPDPVAAFDAMPLMLRRSVIDELIVVKIHPAERGRRAPRPETVEVTWKH